MIQQAANLQQHAEYSALVGKLNPLIENVIDGATVEAAWELDSFYKEVRQWCGKWPTAVILEGNRSRVSES